MGGRPEAAVVWGAAFGGRGGLPRGLGAFSLSARPFSLVFPRKARSFRRRLRVFQANYRRLNGDEPVALSSQSSPFRRLLPAPWPAPAGRPFFFRLYARRGFCPPAWGAAPGPGRPKFAASPCESPRPGSLRRFATRKFPAPTSPLRPGKVRRFAVRKSHQTTRLSASPLRPGEVPPNDPAFPLRRFALAKSHHTTRLFHFATSPWQSPTKLPGFSASP